MELMAGGWLKVELVMNIAIRSISNGIIIGGFQICLLRIGWKE